MLIPRRTVRTSQPQQPAQVNWRNPITKGLYTATVPGQGDVLSSAALSLPTDSKLATLVAGKAVGQAVSGTHSTGIAFPKRNLEQRTELFIQFCSSRRVYGQWMRSATGSDMYSGEYSDTELGWIIHGTGWNDSTPVGEYGAPYSLIGRVAVLCFTWGKDLNGGYGRCFLDSKELTRSSGSPLTTNSDRTQSSAGSSIGPAQNDNNIFLFLAWDRALSSGEVKSVSENPWQIFEDEEDYLFIPEAGGGGSVSLIVADALHGHAVDSPSFSMATYLAVAESLHTQAADNLTLNTTGSANLAIQEAAHAHVSDGVALTTRWLLIVADALHTHAADNLTMGVTGATTLTVADATSVHTADSVALSVIAFLAIADAVSQHAADNLTLDTSNATFLTVQEATHSHGTDGIALTLDTWLAIVEAAHGHTADAPMLSLGQLSLQIADALHAMYSDIVFLTLPGGNLTTDQKFIIRATARRLAAIGLARNNIINRRAS